MARPKSTASPISTVRLPLMWSQYPQKVDVDTRTASTAKPRTDTRPPSVASQISLTLQYWTWTRTQTPRLARNRAQFLGRTRNQRLGGRTRTQCLERTRTQFLGRIRTRRLGGRTRTRRLERTQFLGRTWTRRLGGRTRTRRLERNRAQFLGRTRTRRLEWKSWQFGRKHRPV